MDSLSLQGDIVINDLGSQAFDALAESVAAAEAKLRSFESAAARLQNIQLDNLRFSSTGVSSSASADLGPDAADAIERVRSGAEGAAGAIRDAADAAGGGLSAEVEKTADALDRAKASAENMAASVRKTVGSARDLANVSGPLDRKRQKEDALWPGGFDPSATRQAATSAAGDSVDLGDNQKKQSVDESDIRMMDAMDNSMRKFARSSADAARQTGKIDEALRDSREGASDFEKTADSVVNLAQDALRATGHRTESFALDALPSMAKYLGKIKVAGTAATVAVLALSKAYKAVGDAIEKADARSNVLDDVKVSFNVDPDQVINDLQGALDNRVSKSVALKIAASVDKEGVLADLGTLEDVAAAVQDKATDVGASFDQMMMGAAKDIESGNGAFLEQSGLIDNAYDALKSYADQLGITTAEMSDHQKSVALLNAILAEHKQALLDQPGPPSSLDEYKKKQEELGAAFADTKQSFEDWLVSVAAPGFENALDLKTEALQRMLDVLQLAQDKINERTETNITLASINNEQDRAIYGGLTDRRRQAASGASQDELLAKGLALVPGDHSSGISYLRDQAETSRQLAEDLDKAIALADTFIQEGAPLSALPDLNRLLGTPADYGNTPNYAQMVPGEPEVVRLPTAEVGGAGGEPPSSDEVDKLSSSYAAQADSLNAVAAAYDAATAAYAGVSDDFDAQAESLDSVANAYDAVTESYATVQQDIPQVTVTNPAPVANPAEGQILLNMPGAGSQAPIANPAQGQILLNMPGAGDAGGESPPSDEVDKLTESYNAQADSLNAVATAYDAVTEAYAGVSGDFDAQAESLDSAANAFNVLTDAYTESDNRAVSHEPSATMLPGPIINGYATVQQNVPQISPANLASGRPLNVSESGGAGGELPSSDEVDKLSSSYAAQADSLNSVANAYDAVTEAYAGASSSFDAQAESMDSVVQSSESLTSEQDRLLTLADALREKYPASAAALEAMAAVQDAAGDSSAALGNTLGESAEDMASMAQEAENTAVSVRTLVDAQSGLPLAFDASGLSANALTGQLRTLSMEIDGLEAKSVSAAHSMAQRLAPQLGIVGSIQQGQQYESQARALSDTFQAGNDARVKAGQSPLDPRILETGLSSLQQRWNAEVSDMSRTFGSGMTDAIDQIDRALDGMISGLLSPTTGGLIDFNKILGIGREDEIDEDARRMADVAVKGFKSPWYEGLKHLFPEDVLAQGEESVKKTAAKMVKDHEAGLTNIFYDTDKAAQKVIDKLKAKQNQHDLIDEVREKVKALGQEASDLDIAGALGIDPSQLQGGGAASSAVDRMPTFEEIQAQMVAAFTGEEPGKAGQGKDDKGKGSEDQATGSGQGAGDLGKSAEDQKNDVIGPMLQVSDDDKDAIKDAATDATTLLGDAMVSQATDGAYGSRMIKAITDDVAGNEEKIKSSGTTLGDWLGTAMLDEFADSVPPGLLDILTTNLVPLIIAAQEADKERQ